MSARRLRHLAAIAEVAAADWDRLFPADYPFIRHAYLAALESSGSVSPEAGWTPCHLVLESVDEGVIAACPLYLKTHSYGEFVFDFAWARAAYQAGIEYYPKLLAAIPFTPSPGPRWGAVDGAAEAALLDGLRRLGEAGEASSLHLLFASASAVPALEAFGALQRRDVQYHWQNRGYGDFEGFLAALSADKRKKIRRERRKLVEAGIQYRRQPATELDERDWDEVYALYARTYARRGQTPYLTRAFFRHYAAAPGNALWVVSGFDAAGERLMMALFYQAGERLYGRHWGTAVELDGAHFETCYYQGIDWCLEEGLRHFDAGTQGEHKLARGFEPVITHSAHWIADPRLRAAVARFLVQERAAITHQAEALRQHGAYRRMAG